MTIFQSLQALNAYPISEQSIRNIVDWCELSSDDDATAEVRNSSSYKRAVANVYMFLAGAPNISQGGVSYSFTTDEKKAFRAKANALLAESSGGVYGVFGWQGEDF